MKNKMKQGKLKKKEIMGTWLPVTEIELLLHLLAPN